MAFRIFGFPSIPAVWITATFSSSSEICSFRGDEMRYEFPRANSVVISYNPDKTNQLIN